VTEHGDDGDLKAKIIGINHIELRRMTILRIKMGEAELDARLPVRRDLAINDQVSVHFNKYLRFDRQTGLRL
jgi:hypothetical protein